MSDPTRVSLRDAFDFMAAVQAPFRMQPGLRRLAEGSRQLHPNARDSRHLLEKLQVLDRPEPAALQCMPGYDPMPGLRALAAHAALEHPAAFAWDGERAEARLLGWSVQGGRLRPIASDPPPMAEVGACLASLPPDWRLAGLLALAFAEDFALLDGRTAQIPWLAVALPSHWAPEQKVGLHFAQVHAPVADNTVLLAAGEALARLVSSSTRWERFVWNITPRPTLNAHPALQPAARWHAARRRRASPPRPGGVPSARPSSRYPTPVWRCSPSWWTASRWPRRIDSNEKAQRLHDAIASMSPAVLHYRSLGSVRNALLDRSGAPRGGMTDAAPRRVCCRPASAWARLSCGPGTTGRGTPPEPRAWTSWP